MLCMNTASDIMPDAKTLLDVPMYICRHFHFNLYKILLLSFGFSKTPVMHYVTTTACSELTATSHFVLCVNIQNTEDFSLQKTVLPTIWACQCILHSFVDSLKFWCRGSENCATFCFSELIQFL